MDLPLVAVSIPQHIFLRWDDGETVIDFELTDGGRRRSPDELEGAVPRPLTKKGFTSVVLSNRSSAWLVSPLIKDEGRLEAALRFANQAVAFDPENDAAHLARAQCLARLGDTPGALESARRALELAPLDVASPLVAAECLLLAGRPGEALPWFDRARETDPDDGDVMAGRLGCLARLGRDDEVLAEATAFLVDRDHTGVRLLRLGAMVRLDRDGWREEMERLGPEPHARWALRLSVVEALLERGAAHEALTVLDDLTDLDRDPEKAAGEDPDLASLLERPDGVMLLIRNDERKRLREKAKSLRQQAEDLR
jgi:tetratricopeptide (TPR) repeat protein